jgi:hypothetical protein
MKANVEPNAPPESDLEGDLPADIRPARDYSQRPQRAIKLKPSIAREKASVPVYARPPRELLEAAPQGAAPVPEPVVAEPMVAAPAAAAVRAPGLAADVQEAVTRAATRAGLAPSEWVDRAARALAQQGAANGPVTNEEVILYTLREMNLRLAALERPRGLRQWVRRALLKTR